MSKKRMWAAFALAVSAGFALATPAWAGTIVLHGDQTPAFSLSNTPANATETGTSLLFTNILGGGSTVLVLDTTNGFTGPTRVRDFYDGIGGVSASFHSGALTDAALAGVDLLVVHAPDDAFSAAEASAVLTHVNGGGTLLALGEASVISYGVSTNTFINGLFSGIGSSMSLNFDTFDLGGQTATGSQIIAHPLTAGVAAFGYGATASVNGGTPLLLTLPGRTFPGATMMAVESSVPVPEPATATLFGLVGVAFVAYRRRRRRPEA